MQCDIQLQIFHILRLSFCQLKCLMYRICVNILRGESVWWLANYLVVGKNGRWGVQTKTYSKKKFRLFNFIISAKTEQHLFLLWNHFSKWEFRKSRDGSVGRPFASHAGDTETLGGGCATFGCLTVRPIFCFSRTFWTNARHMKESVVKVAMLNSPRSCRPLPYTHTQ